MENNFISMKDNIILTAIDLINEKGIQSFSAREIAKRLGITHGAIYKYFPQKKHLLEAVLDKFASFDKEIIKSLKIKNLDALASIRYYVDAYAIYYQSYPAITAIAQNYDAFLCDEEVADKSREIFGYRMNSVKELIEEAQSANLLKNDINSEYLSDIILSTIRGICLKWRMGQFSISLREQIIEATEMLIAAFALS